MISKSPFLKTSRTVVTFNKKPQVKETFTFKLNMTGETDLSKMLQTLKPQLHAGDYVFCVVEDLSRINSNDMLMVFRESEGYTVILQKELADDLELEYAFIAAWITLTVHSSLEAVGLTAAFSKVLSEKGISCNVVAAFYHDHLFVNQKDAEKAMQVLASLSE